MDLSNSVILPREDFVELQTAAWDNIHPTTNSERLGSIAQTTAVFVVIALAVTAGSWGYAQAKVWSEKKSSAIRIAEADLMKKHR